MCVVWPLPLVAALNWAATGARTGQRGRETRGTGVHCTCLTVHQPPRVIKRVFVFGGMPVVCFFKCKIACVDRGSFCFEVKVQKVLPLHCTALVMALFLF